MQSPFLFGRTVSHQEFTNRVKEIKRLKDNFNNGVNTIVISPRRWGKSSLVKRVSEEVRSAKIKIVEIDLLGIRNEEEFYKVFATETIKATSGKLTEWMEAARQFFKHVIPRISVGPDPANDFEISFEWQDLERNYTEVLNLPEKIAANKNIRVVVCIDEFQNLGIFTEPLLFQKRLRSEWQHQKRVSYCLYGSQQHMMTELFERQSMPFYKFGDVMYLGKISRQDWVSFIIQKFKGTGKEIDEPLAGEIATLVQDHSYYVQQLAHMVWIKTVRRVTEDHIDSALNDLLEQNSILYTRDTEDLPASQIAYLRALAGGVHSGLSAQAMIDKYGLTSSAGVAKARKALIRKELIEERNGGSHFLDPVYALWFRRFIK